MAAAAGMSMGRRNEREVEKMKRKIALLLVLLLAVFSGCQQPEKAAEEPQAKPLRERGSELVVLMAEMAGSPYYAQAYTGNSGIMETLDGIGEGDFSEPKGVYSIHFPEEALSTLLESAGLTGLDGLSEGLRENLKARAFGALPAQINAMAGAETLAAASICSASEVFVDPGVTDNLIYLYVYEDAVPAVVVFLPGEGGAVSATGTLLLYDGFSLGSLEEIQGLLGPLGAEVAEVTE